MRTADHPRTAQPKGDPPRKGGSPRAPRGDADQSALAGRVRGRSLPLTLPAWLLVTCVGVAPMAYGLWMSVTDQAPGSSGRFVGLENFIKGVFTTPFLNSLWITLLIAATGIVLQLVIGYLLADLLNQQMRGYQIMRTVLLVPMMLTPVIIGLIFRFMFNPTTGILDYVMTSMGVDIPWFTNQWWARIFVVMIDSWLHVPFMMLMILAGMAGIDRDCLEAAQVDGAGWWATTRFVILPALRPVIIVALVVRIVDAARMFDQVYASTKGGPGTSTQTLSMMAYNETFAFFHFGQGIAIALALTALMFPVYFVYVRLTRV